MAGPFGERPSVSAEAARRAELSRIERMTPRERALLALRLGRRSRVLVALSREAAPAPPSSDGEGDP